MSHPSRALRRRTHTLRAAAVTLSLALATTLAARPARALEVARITQYGYIVVDEPDAPIPYEGSVPIDNNGALFGFVADVTAAIDRIPGAPHPDYVATMQTERSASNGALAFYLPIRNEVRGLGMRSPTGGGETYNINNVLGTAFPLFGYVWLNNIRFYTQPGFEEFGRYLICTQEFGHRYGTFLRITPQPGTPMPTADAGAPDDAADASADPDAGMMVMPMPDGSMTIGDATAPPDGDTADATAPPEEAGTPPGPDLPVTALLGRDNSHWSYFVNTGGSPMEGNDWEQLSENTFRTRRASFRFSPLDLYQMGLIPASAVPPFWLIAEPDVMGQRDMDGQTIRPSSKPEYGDRTVTIRGRRVTYTIDDVIAANGVRNPSSSIDPGDAGADGSFDAGPTDAAVGDGNNGRLPDGAADEPIRRQDMRVAWVLVTTRARLGSSGVLEAQFDRAIASCAQGFDEATMNRSRLRAVVGGVLPDAGADAGPEAGRDAGDGGGETSPPVVRAGGGCACRVPGSGVASGDDPSGPGRATGALAAALGALGLCVTRARRRARRARCNV